MKCMNPYTIKLPFHQWLISGLRLSLKSFHPLLINVVSWRRNRKQKLYTSKAHHTFASDIQTPLRKLLFSIFFPFFHSGKLIICHFSIIQSIRLNMSVRSVAYIVCDWTSPSQSFRLNISSLFNVTFHETPIQAELIAVFLRLSSQVPALGIQFALEYAN